MKNYLKINGMIVLMIFIGAGCLLAAGSTLGDLERLGMHLYKDKNLSFYQNQSCQTCHHPLSGFADRSNFLHPYDQVVSLGSDGVSLGGRNAPTSAYAGYSPGLSDATGEWIGGMFWDGRATGATLGDPLAEQALGPPLNPVEMALPDKRTVIEVIVNSDYYHLWRRIYGPIDDLDDLNEVDAAYDNFGRAIAAYERSTEVTQFTSKFDLALDQFTPAEVRGKELFQDNCASCHPDTASLAPRALFTTYGYANIGVPVNPMVTLEEPDRGLGPVVDDTAQDGKFKIPTLRNIAMTAPYSHNGAFPTLYDMVAFINDNSDFVPEVEDNVVAPDVVGGLELSQDDIDDIIAFLHTLTDDY